MESADYVRLAFASSRKRAFDITTSTRDWERHFPWRV
jgi:hypothetical protein